MGATEAGPGGGDTLDTTVLGDTNGARATAAGLRRLQNAMNGLAGRFQSSRSLTQHWEGDASSAFGDHIQKRYQDTESAADAGSDLATATDNWCDGINTVKARMQSIRETAAQAGIPVQGNIVGPPMAMPQEPQTTTVPGAPLGGPSSIPEMTEHANQMNAYNAQQKTWNELHQSYTDARGIHRATLDAMKQALGRNQAGMNGITVGGKAATAALAFAGDVNTTSMALANVANRSRATAISAFQRMKADPNGASAATYAQAWQAASADADKQESFGKGLGRMPLQKWASAKLDFRRGIPLLEKLPVLGTAFGAGLSAVSIAEGAPPGKAIAQNVSSTAVVVGTGEILGELVPEGSAVGAVVKTVVGLGAGEGTDYLVGKAYDAQASEQAQQDYHDLQSDGG